MKRSLLLILCILVLGSFVFAEGPREKDQAKLKNMQYYGINQAWEEAGYPTASRIAGVVMKYTDSVVTVQSSGGGTRKYQTYETGSVPDGYGLNLT